MCEEPGQAFFPWHSPRLLIHHALGWLLLSEPGRVNDPEMWRGPGSPHTHPLHLGAKPGNVCPFSVGSFRSIVPVKSPVPEATIREQRISFTWRVG